MVFMLPTMLLRCHVVLLCFSGFCRMFPAWHSYVLPSSLLMLPIHKRLIPHVPPVTPVPSPIISMLEVDTGLSACSTT